MGMQSLSESAVLVDLSCEPELNDVLKDTTEVVRQRGDCDIVLDFSQVDIITSSSLSKLLKLRKVLLDCDHCLILCSVSPATKGIFAVTALEGVFDVVDDRFAALALLQGETAGN